MNLIRIAWPSCRLSREHYRHHQRQDCIRRKMLMFYWCALSALSSELLPDMKSDHRVPSSCVDSGQYISVLPGCHDMVSLWSYDTKLHQSRKECSYSVQYSTHLYVCSIIFIGYISPSFRLNDYPTPVHNHAVGSIFLTKRSEAAHNLSGFRVDDHELMNTSRRPAAFVRGPKRRSHHSSPRLPP